MKDLKELIDIMVRSLVDTPDDIDIKEIKGEQTTVFELRVNSADLGKVIGRQGRTAKSMRTILTAAATKQQVRAILEIVD